MKKQELIGTRDKIKKKFNNGMTMALTIRNILIGLIIIFLICTIGDIIERVIYSNGANAIGIIFETVKNSFGEITSSTNDTIHFGVLNVLKYIIIILFSDRIAKIFENSIQKETPFSNENVKNMKVLSKLAFLYAICSINIGYEIVVFLIVKSISYVFEYGYELQIESDETL